MPDISYQNVIYVPLLAMESFESGGHNEMILPNSGNRDDNRSIVYRLLTKNKERCGRECKKDKGSQKNIRYSSVVDSETTQTYCDESAR